MEEVKLTHAEVITQYQSDEVFKEIPTEKGKILSFRVKTRINDRVANSPFLFRNCSFFSSSEEEINDMKSKLQAGSTVEITGRTDRNKSKKNDQYYDSVRVEGVLPLDIEVESQEAVNDEDLPF